MAYLLLESGAKIPLEGAGAGAILLESFTLTPSFTLSGPVFGNSNAASSAFTLVPDEVLTDTVTIVLSGTPGGTTNTNSLAFVNSNTNASFTYTPANNGVETITLTSGAGYTVIGSPWSYQVGGGGGIPGPTEQQITAMMAHRANATAAFRARQRRRAESKAG